MFLGNGFLPRSSDTRPRCLRFSCTALDAGLAVAPCCQERGGPTSKDEEIGNGSWVQESRPMRFAFQLSSGILPRSYEFQLICKTPSFPDAPEPRVLGWT
jgi:hypothetical protein